MMSMNSKQAHFAMHPAQIEHKYTTLHSSSEAIRRACLQTPQVNDPRDKTSLSSLLWWPGFMHAPPNPTSVRNNKGRSKAHPAKARAA